MKKTKILYVGNDLALKTKYNSAMQTLYELLSKEGFEIIKTSSKKNVVLRFFDMLLSIIQNRNVDYLLIDTFSTTAFYYAFFSSQLARFLKLKYIPILHGGNLPERITKFPIMSKMIFSNSHKNIAPSNYLQQAFSTKGYNVTYIPNPIETKKYLFKERVTIQPKLLWVRAFRNIYNPVMAIEVVQKLKKIYPEIKLCMVGPRKDNTLELVTALIKKNKLEKNIEITGVLKKEQWHKKSEFFDVFINTTNIDNTPVSVIEAMALGLPVVSTNVGGIPFLVTNNLDGYLVNKADVNAMVKVICNIIDHPNVSITKNARIKAESFDWGTVKTLWLNILK